MVKNKFRILQLIAGLDIGDSHGGAERFGVELSRNLERDVFDVSICAFWRRNSPAETYWLKTLKDSDTPVYFASDWRGKFHPIAYLSGVITLARLARKNKIHLIHSHFQFGTFSAICARLLGYTRAAIRTAHINREWGNDLLAWIMRRIFTDWVYPIFLNKEVGVSQNIVNGLRRRPGTIIFGRHPKLIHNAINLANHEDRGDEALVYQESRQENNLVIGTIGRLADQKGIRYLLEASPIVFRKFPNAQLIIIGSGNLQPELEFIAEHLAITKQVTFLGQIENPLPHLRSMDIFVLPSLWEGLPTVLLECMVNQVPIVATNVPGTNELLTHRVNGLLIPSRDPDSIAEAVLEIARNNDLRLRLIENGTKTVANYSIDKIASMYEETYSEILGHV